MKRLRIFVLVSFLASLTGCSNSFVYNQLDWLVPWYLDDYVGPNRGVLVSFHASEPEYDLVNGTYGPFPLDLFD